MKKIEEIEEEYSKYQLQSKYVNNLDEFPAFITIIVDDIQEDKKVLFTEIKLNCKAQLQAKIKNLFLSLFRIEEVDFYTKDNAVLEEVINYISTYVNYYNQILSIANEENFLELTRFVAFLCEYYNEQIDYFDSIREALELQLKGFSYSNSSYQDNREVIDCFFNQKIKEYQGEKAVEKKKKMC